MFSFFCGRAGGDLLLWCLEATPQPLELPAGWGKGGLGEGHGRLVPSSRWRGTGRAEPGQGCPAGEAGIVSVQPGWLQGGAVCVCLCTCVCLCMCVHVCMCVPCVCMCMCVCMKQGKAETETCCNNLLVRASVKILAK